MGTWVGILAETRDGFWSAAEKLGVRGSGSGGHVLIDCGADFAGARWEKPSLLGRLFGGSS